jgi:UDP-N-acetylglucosamine 2-epimerase (non-hydrolysing)
MLAFEKLVVEQRPAMVVVAGDVNSTLGCSIVAAKANVPVAHLEAGLRSGDWTMPEEINRIVTDRLTSLHLTPSRDADTNLLREGAAPDGIVCVGNCMIDSVVRHLPSARSLDALAQRGLAKAGYALVTLHRPSNVDEPERLRELLAALCGVARLLRVVFPVHPRTRSRLRELSLETTELEAAGLTLLEPLGYLEFLALEDSARLVITDSGGVQEETTVLGVPCLTVRDNTERPITITEGTNKLIGTDPRRILPEVALLLNAGNQQGRVPELWDGRAGQRAAAAIVQYLAANC